MPQWLSEVPWYCWFLAGAVAFTALVFIFSRQPVPEDYSENEGSDT